MKIAGIVAEYNPFHNGHAHHIERTRAPEGGGASHVAVVLSGCFVQRGEPALLPKASRVRMALAGGADLVLELPVPWSLSSAEGFAFGAVSLLDALGCVDLLSFGSGCGDLARLEAAVEALEDPRFPKLLAYHLEGGIPFPEARQRTVAELRSAGLASLFEEANNTLGIEYLKALRRLSSPIRPFTIPRFGAGHDAPLPAGDMASASLLRSMVQGGRLVNAAAYMPRAAADELAGAAAAGLAPADTSRLERAVLARLRRLSAEDFARLPGVSEGLENRLANAARKAGSLAELLELAKTRRYPLTRLQRLVWSAFLGIPASLAGGPAQGGWNPPPYIRVLGMNERGGEILRQAKPRLPLLTKASQLEPLDERSRKIFALESRAADLYALALPKPYPCGAEYTTGLIRAEKH